MHAALLTIILATGAGPYASYEGEIVSQQPYAEEGCSQCGSTSGGCGCFGANRWYERQHEALLARGGMPQTCYSPRYGCYPGNDREIQRYPAFHGSFYRRPYNYRNVFDYPWHAELHEPTSLFSYNVPSPETGSPIRGESLPLPVSSRRTPSQVTGPPVYQANQTLRATPPHQPLAQRQPATQYQPAPQPQPAAQPSPSYEPMAQRQLPTSQYRPPAQSTQPRLGTVLQTYR